MKMKIKRIKIKSIIANTRYLLLLGDGETNERISDLCS